MTTRTSSSSKTPARDPMEVYLEQLEERDRREKRHKKYIDAFQAFADKTAARVSTVPKAPEITAQATPEVATPDAKGRPKTGYYPSFRGRASPTPSSPGPVESTQVAQLRADLATANNVRAEQEAELKLLKDEASESKITTSKQAKRITELEKANKKLEHRVANTAEEVTRQRDLAREAQDEMLALQVEVNAKDKKLQKVEADNKDLVDRWMREKGEIAQRMNDAMEKGQKGPKKR